MLDEVGNDQEVARIVHAGDDIELEGEPRAVILLRRALRKAMHRKPVGEPLLGLFAQFLIFGFLRVGIGADGKARQDRLARHRPERAALGDLDG